jgi:serine/threonine protein kinase
MDMYSEILERIKSSLVFEDYRNDSFWQSFFGRNLRVEQGWKIHVSFVEDEFERLIQEILPKLIEERITFKVPVNASKLKGLNAGQYGQDQIGKCLTIYPNSYEEFEKLVKWADASWTQSAAPRVSLEPRLRKNGCVSFRYGDLIGRFYLSNLGQPIRYVEDRAGQKIEDTIERTFELLQELKFEYFLDDENKYSEILSRIEESYIVLKKNPKSASLTLFAIRKSDLTKVTIKMGFKDRAEVSSDTYAVIKNEANILKFLKERNYPYCSEVIELIENDREVAVVIKYIDGVGIGESIPELEDLSVQIIEAVRSLHEIGVVHADLKEENIIYDDGKVTLIDFGSSGCLNMPIQYNMKTPGYYDLSIDSDTYNFEIDNYALRRVLFGIQVGCKVTNIKNDDGTLYHLIQSSSQRSSVLQNLYQRVLPNDLNSLKPDKVFRAAMDYYDSPANRWFNGHEYSSYQLNNINIGACGVSLGLLGLRNQISRPEDIDNILEATLNRVSKDYLNQNSAGLFTGNGGNALTLLVFGKKYNNKEWLDTSKKLIFDAISVESHADYFSGIAGTLLAAVLINREFKDELLDQLIIQKMVSLIEKLESKEGLFGIVNSKTGHIETGLAHGSAGIAYCLYHVGEYFDDDGIKILSKKIFRSIFDSMRSSHGVFFDSSKVDVSPNSTWCKGIGGILWAQLDSFGVTGDMRESFDWYAKVFESSVGITNPTLCHGMAGQLELLEALVAIDPTPLRCGLSERVRQSLTAMIVEKNDKQYFLSENMEYVTPDLWIGFLGTANSMLRESKNMIMSHSYFVELLND